MSHDSARLQRAHAALARALIANPKLFETIQLHIPADGTDFLDRLALLALRDEETGQTEQARLAGQRLADFHSGEVSNRSTYGTQVDSILGPGQNVGVAFNSASGIGVPNKKADSRPMRRFLRPSHTIGASSSMAGRGEGAFGLAGSFLPVRQPCHAPATPDWRRDGGLKPKKEAAMPKLRRALARLFPVFPAPVSTLPSLIEARALAAWLVSSGRRAVIQPVAEGYTVTEVAA